MPELPEVQTIATDLNSHIVGKTIRTVTVFDSLVVKQPAADFIKRLSGQKIQHITRHGKSLVIGLSSKEHWVVQLMMTGQLIFNAPPSPHARVSIEFSDGTSLCYNDQRRFGHLRVVASLDEIKYFRILGPEPLAQGFSPTMLFDRLRQSNRPIKNVLLDHTVVAGIGNIYASEILFAARIHPCRKSSSIKNTEAKQIFKETQRILNAAVKARGCSMRNYRDADGKEGGFTRFLKVYKQQGKPCPSCACPIEVMMLSARSTFLCPRCQQ